MKPFQKFMTGALAALFITSPLIAEHMKFPQGKTYGTTPSGSKWAHAEAITTQYTRYVETWYKENGQGGYIESRDTHGNQNIITVSEAHGYGMMIFAIMDDQTRFDKMVQFYESNKLSGSNLMQWAIGGSSIGSATDGDLDIAYAFLLAEKQWGGNNNYRSKALAISDDILSHSLNNAGNFISCGSGYYGDRELSRPADWMAGHLRAFAQVDDGSASVWLTIADEIYNRYNGFVDGNSSSNGLISDFVKNGQPASGGEDANDYNYYTNSARVPLRFAMDFATNPNSETVSAALAKINGELIRVTEGNATNMKRGYTLSGGALSEDNSLVFLAPFGAGLIAQSDRNLINSVWGEMQQPWTTEASTPSFDDALKLLSMIVMTGNWWTPTDSDTWEPIYIDSSGVVLDNFGNAYGDDNAQCELGAVNGVFWGDNELGGIHGDSTYFLGGGYWYTFKGDGATIKAADGTELTDSTTDLMVTDHRLDLTFEITEGDSLTYDYAGLEVPLISDVTIDTAAARYVDLTKMTGITVKYKCSETIDLIIKTKDDKEVVTADAGGWIGNYAIPLIKSDTIVRTTFSVEDLRPSSDSPLAAAVTDSTITLTKLQHAFALAFQCGENLDRGLNVHLQVEDIIFNGVQYSDFGIEYRAATIVGINETSAKTLSSHKVTANVTAEKIGLSIPAAQSGAAAVSLYTVSGRQVAHTTSAVSSGMNTMDVPTSNLAAGIYLMRINVNGAITSAQISLTK